MPVPFLCLLSSRLLHASEFFNWLEGEKDCALSTDATPVVMCGPCTCGVLSPLWLSGNCPISLDSSPHSLNVSLIVYRQHAAYDRRPRVRIALMACITLTNSIHLHMIDWSIFRQAFLFPKVWIHPNIRILWSCHIFLIKRIFTS